MINIDDGNEAVLEAWYGIERISYGRVIPATREALLEFVESPLKEVVGLLYDRNIMTLGSSCNITDYFRGDAWISLDGASLSPANQLIVDDIPDHERTTIRGLDVPIIGLHFPIGGSDHPFDVSRRASRVAELFEVQPFIWVPKWSLEEARKHFKHDGIDLETCSLDDLLGVMDGSGYFYDEESGTFYSSEEQFQKEKAAKG